MKLKKNNIDYLNNLVLEHSGNALRPDQHYLFETRLASLAQNMGCDTVDTLVDYLILTPFGKDHEQAIKLMMNHETLFFRDISSFTLLKDRVMPELIDGTAPIRFWSAACSSGQEVYSLAMILKDHFSGLCKQGRIQLTASDIVPQIVDRARKGLYQEMEIKRGLPEEQKTKYFHPEGNLWKIREDLTQMVSFDLINLLESWPFRDPMDVIFVRYVLIYFDGESKRNLIKRMITLLKPGGFLFVGGSESLMGFSELKLVEHNGAVCYQKI